MHASSIGLQYSVFWLLCIVYAEAQYNMYWLLCIMYAEAGRPRGYISGNNEGVAPAVLPNLHTSLRGSIVELRVTVSWYYLHLNDC